MSGLDPKKFIITRKRKKYKFALFHNHPLCFEVEEWESGPSPQLLEIGAGTGLFSVALAEHMPNRQLVAVDVKADRLQTGAKYAEEKQLTNLRFLRLQVDHLLDIFLPDSLESLWVTFPDPFPKDSSQRRRLTHPQFLAIYERLLVKGGALYFKTDATKLFNWSLEQLIGNGWHIEELSFDLHSSDLPGEYKIETTYEARYRAEGYAINFVKATPPVH